MQTHKFKIGEVVLVNETTTPAGTFVVIQRMPKHHGQFEYRVRSSCEANECVVRESQLRTAPFRIAH